jgi:hypothetical protein
MKVLSRRMRGLSLFLFLTLLVLCWQPLMPQVVMAEDPSPPVTEPAPANPKLDSTLNQLVTLETNLDPTTASSFSMEASGDTVRAIIECLPGQEAAVTQIATDSGATVEATAGNLIQIMVPTTSLSDLTANPSVAFVRIPYYPVLDGVPPSKDTTC